MITQLPVVRPENLPGVSLRYLEEKMAEENVFVHVVPNGVIPLHRHKVKANMYIVAGGGRVLSTNENNGRSVGPGDCVLFEKDLPHGFEAGPNGLIFLSCNGRIRQADGSLDLQFA